MRRVYPEVKRADHRDDGCDYDYAVNVFDLTRWAAMTPPSLMLTRLIPRDYIDYVGGNNPYTVSCEREPSFEDACVILKPESDYQMACVRAALLENYLKPGTLRMYRREKSFEDGAEVPTRGTWAPLFIAKPRRGDEDEDDGDDA
jgi:hypothetical protein